PKLQVGCHGKERRKPFTGWETRRARRTALFIFCLTRRNRDTLARDASPGRHRPAAARPAARPPHLPHPGAAAGTRPARCARARAARPPDAPLASPAARAAGIGAAALRALVAAGLAEPIVRARATAAAPEDAPRPTLTPAQRTAADAIAQAVAGGGHVSFLLHGITGSGK